MAREYALKVQPQLSSSQSAAIYDALRLQRCNGTEQLLLSLVDVVFERLERQSSVKSSPLLAPVLVLTGGCARRQAQLGECESAGRKGSTPEEKGRSQG